MSIAFEIIHSLNDSWMAHERDCLSADLPFGN